jgi:hypothetical protein
LSDCNVDHEDILTIDTLGIIVHHWDGEAIEIDDISPNDTTDDVNRILLEKKEIPNEQQKLLFEGKAINDSFLSRPKDHSQVRPGTSRAAQRKAKEGRVQAHFVPNGRSCVQGKG